MSLGEGYFRKLKKPAKRCAVCRFYAPTSSTRGSCRIEAPVAETDAERAKWKPTEPDSTCPSFSRLRAPSGKPKGPVDVPGRTRMDFA